jgi:hypothetical protein
MNMQSISLLKAEVTPFDNHLTVFQQMSDEVFLPGLE